MEDCFKKFHHAAYSYIGLGVVIVFLTIFFIPSVHFRTGFWPLAGGIVVLLILSYFLYRGVAWLAKVLSFFALSRTVWWMYSYFAFGDETGSWAYLVNAILNGVILFMLVRAAWDITIPLDRLPFRGDKNAKTA